MKRNWDLEEVSDGKRYTEQDMAKVGCEDCAGCSSCCQGMGDSILLDPGDIYQLTKGLSVTVEQLLGEGKIELGVADGIILPHLKMSQQTDACSFLNEEGRCQIHSFRPGICRLFPLGRIYEAGDFTYFLQVHECKKTTRTKVKISKWLGIENIKQYHAYILTWHDLLEKLQKNVVARGNQEEMKQVSMQVLKLFYLQPYEKEKDFYQQFMERKNFLDKIVK